MHCLLTCAWENSKFTVNHNFEINHKDCKGDVAKVIQSFILKKL